jgi:heterodisulfide reductase subunit C
MSLSVSGRAVHCSQPAYYCSKHVEVSNVIHILQNKAIVHQVVDKNKFMLWRTVRETSNEVYNVTVNSEELIGATEYLTL